MSLVGWWPQVWGKKMFSSAIMGPNTNGFIAKPNTNGFNAGPGSHINANGLILSRNGPSAEQHISPRQEIPFTTTGPSLENLLNSRERRLEMGKRENLLRPTVSPMANLGRSLRTTAMMSEGVESSPSQVKNAIKIESSNMTTKMTSKTILSSDKNSTKNRVDNNFTGRVVSTTGSTKKRENLQKIQKRSKISGSSGLSQTPSDSQTPFERPPFERFLPFKSGKTQKSGKTKTQKTITNFNVRKLAENLVDSIDRKLYEWTPQKEAISDGNHKWFTGRYVPVDCSQQGECEAKECEAFSEFKFSEQSDGSPKSDAPNANNIDKSLPPRFNKLPPRFPAGVYILNGPNPGFAEQRWNQYNWFDGHALLRMIVVPPSLSSSDINMTTMTTSRNYSMNHMTNMTTEPRSSMTAPRSSKRCQTTAASERSVIFSQDFLRTPRFLAATEADRTLKLNFGEMSSLNFPFGFLRMVNAEVADLFGLRKGFNDAVVEDMRRDGDYMTGQDDTFNLEVPKNGLERIIQIRQRILDSEEDSEGDSSLGKEGKEEEDSESFGRDFWKIEKQKKQLSLILARYFPRLRYTEANVAVEAVEFVDKTKNGDKKRLQFLALREEGLPYTFRITKDGHIDSRDGHHTSFNGQLQHRASAHNKISHTNGGEYYIFGGHFLQPAIEYTVISTTDEDDLDDEASPADEDDTSSSTDITKKLNRKSPKAYVYMDSSTDPAGVLGKIVNKPFMMHEALLTEPLECYDGNYGNDGEKESTSSGRGHVIIPVHPLQIDLMRIAIPGQPWIQWAGDKGLPSFYAVFSRSTKKSEKKKSNGDSQCPENFVKWFQLPAHFALHYHSAVEFKNEEKCPKTGKILRTVEGIELVAVIFPKDPFDPENNVDFAGMENEGTMGRVQKVKLILFDSATDSAKNSAIETCSANSNVSFNKKSLCDRSVLEEDGNVIKKSLCDSVLEEEDGSSCVLEDSRSKIAMGELQPYFTDPYPDSDLYPELAKRYAKLVERKEIFAGAKGNPAIEFPIGGGTRYFYGPALGKVKLSATTPDSESDSATTPDSDSRTEPGFYNLVKIDLITEKIVGIASLPDRFHLAGEASFVKALPFSAASASPSEESLSELDNNKTKNDDDGFLMAFISRSGGDIKPEETETRWAVWSAKDMSLQFQVTVDNMPDGFHAVYVPLTESQWEALPDTITDENS